MANKLSFTETRLRAVVAPEKGRVYYRDTRQPGLQLCITATGSRTYYFVRRIDGQPTRMKIGRHGDISLDHARKIAKERAWQVANGINPVAERRARREEATLGDLWEHWLEHHGKPMKRTWPEDCRKFDKHLAHWQKRKLSAIDVADVLAWHRRLGKNHGKYLANRARALLSALFEKAHEIGYKGINPCKGVRKFREESRERYLLPEEVKPFFAALAEEPPLWRDFFLLCLFTGGRKSTVAAMRWKEIIGLKAEEPVWTIPADKSKGGLPITIPLSPPAVAVLRTRRAENGKTPWVFPADTTSGHVVDPRKAWLRTVKRAELTNLRTHDLRRTLGSWQANHGASLAIIGKSLGHGADSKATAVYARLAMDPVRQSVSQAAVALLEAGGEALDVSSQPAERMEKHD